MGLLRSVETEKKYRDFITNGHLEQECALCRREPIKKAFEYWKIIYNAFPYDRIASIHDMLVPLRHVDEDELTVAELVELKEIKETYVNETYQCILEVTRKGKSVPTHFHLHLITFKDDL